MENEEKGKSWDSPYTSIEDAIDSSETGNLYVDGSEIYAYQAPRYKWSVAIPKGNEFVINYKELRWWARLWMKFIGWDVKKIDSDK